MPAAVKPGLEHGDPAKRRIVPALLGETARLVLELRDRRRAGEEPAELERLGRFRWVLNDAKPGPDG